MPHGFLKVSRAMLEKITKITFSTSCDNAPLNIVMTNIINDIFEGWSVCFPLCLKKKKQNRLVKIMHIESIKELDRILNLSTNS
jgi:hypothetical protein